MIKYLLALLLFCGSTSAFAQTVCRVEPVHDDCPPGATRNPPVSPLDQVYMEAAFRASFRGTFNREPSMIDGSGKDDGCYYVRASNHYGPAGDGQCHAGWSGYWESWLATGRGDLALVQTPARFLPSFAPPAPPIQPAPVTPPIFSDAAILQYLGTLKADLDAGLVTVRQDIADFRESLNSKWAAILKSPYFQVIAGAIITWATTYKIMKP